MQTSNDKVPSINPQGSPSPKFIQKARSLRVKRNFQAYNPLQATVVSI